MTSNINFSTCLRPDFTRQIYEQLIDGQALNVFCKRGNGRTQLIDDLESITRQQGHTVIRIDIGGYANNFRGFLRTIENQILPLSALDSPKTLMLEQWNDPEQDLPSLDILLKGNHIDLKDRKLIILFDNFDYLFRNDEQRFPESFFNELNYFKDQPHVGICCISKESIKLNEKIYFEGGNRHAPSRLVFRPIDIPDLTRFEIEKVLNLRLQKDTAWQKEPRKDKVIKACYEHPAKLRFLEIIIDSYSYNHQNISASKRIKTCYGQYRKRYPAQGLGTYYSRLKKEILDWLQPFKK